MKKTVRSLLTISVLAALTLGTIGAAQAEEAGTTYDAIKENGYITMAEDGHISLLPKGQEIAERIYERHQVLTRLFVDLGVDERIAQDDACKVEHDLSEETFEAIKRHATHCGTH